MRRPALPRSFGSARQALSLDGASDRINQLPQVRRKTDSQLSQQSLRISVSSSP